MKTLIIIFGRNISDNQLALAASYIDGAFQSWAHPLKLIWFVKTDMTTKTLRDQIVARTNYRKGTIVLNVTNTAWASNSLNKEVAEWMKNNL